MATEHVNRKQIGKVTPRPLPTRAVNKTNEKHLAVNSRGQSNCEIVHLVKHLNKSVVALQTAIIFIYSRRICRVVNCANEKKTRHHVQNRDVFKNLMTWFQKTEHVCILHAISADRKCL